MIIALDTSTPICKLTLINADTRVTTEWEAGRELARGLLSYIQKQLEANTLTWVDLTGIIAFQGPGSFTGLRIGITILNTLSYAQSIPIVGEMGDAWQEHGLARLNGGENDHVVLPEYGGEANITQPRK